MNFTSLINPSRNFQNSLLEVSKKVSQFLLVYRRTPLSSGYSPAEIMFGRQIRGPIDVILPNPVQQWQGQVGNNVNPNKERKFQTSGGSNSVRSGIYCKQTRMVGTATVVEVRGPRSVTVKTE